MMLPCLLLTCLAAALEEPVPDLTALESQEVNLAWQKPVRGTGPSGGPHGMEKAVDGNVDSCWWGGGNPNWLAVDLGQVYSINKIQLYFYADGVRYYHYRLEASADGEQWRTVAEELDTTTPTPANGLVHRFPAVAARHVKVVIPDSVGAYGAAHLRELWVYEARPLSAVEWQGPPAQKAAWVGARFRLQELAQQREARTARAKRIADQFTPDRKRGQELAHRWVAHEKRLQERWAAVETSWQQAATDAARLPEVRGAIEALAAEQQKLWDDFLQRTHRTAYRVVRELFGRTTRFNEQTYPGRRAAYHERSAKLYRDAATGLLSKESLAQRDLERAVRYLRLAHENHRRAQRWALRRPAESPVWAELLENRKSKIANRKSKIANRAEGRFDLCLNGEWEASAEGNPEEPPREGWQPVRVPHVPLASSAVGKDSAHVWYRLPFTFPAIAPEGRVFLRFEAVAQHAEVFVNGRYCGHHYGGAARFRVDVTEAARPGGENWLYVCAQDRTLTETSDGGNDYAYWDIYGRMLGIWQDVYLEVRPAVYIADVFAHPSVRQQRLDVEVEVVNAGPRPLEAQVEPRVYDGPQEVLALPPQSVALEPGETAVVVAGADWPDAQLWGIGGKWGEPKLYGLRTEVRGTKGNLLDALLTRFGFREFWVEGTQFVLNGEPLTLQGYPLLYDPWHGPYMGHPEYIRRHFRIARSLNFNFVRFFTSENDFNYTLADEIGYLCEPGMVHNGSPPRNLDGTPDYLDPVRWVNLTEQYRAWVKKYRAHPSVILWSTENEVFQVVPSDAEAPETRQAYREQLRLFGHLDEVTRGADPEHRPVHHHGCHAAYFAGDADSFEVLDIHYPESVAWVAQMLADENPRPVIVGEFHASGPDLAAQAKDLSARLTGYLDAGASVMPHDLVGQSSYNEERLAWMGPWGEAVRAATEAVTVPVLWPSLSGPGTKVERTPVGRNYFYSALINWFDPNRPEWTPNLLAQVFRDRLRPMPPAPENGPAQVLVTVRVNGQPAPHANVFLRPLDDQPTDVVGVRADALGTAWFPFLPPGRYRAEAQVETDWRPTEFEAPPVPFEVPPGYGHLTRVELKV